MCVVKHKCIINIIQTLRHSFSCYYNTNIHFSLLDTAGVSAHTHRYLLVYSKEGDQLSRFFLDFSFFLYFLPSYFDMMSVFYRLCLFFFFCIMALMDNVKEGFDWLIFQSICIYKSLKRKRFFARFL